MKAGTDLHAYSNRRYFPGTPLQILLSDPQFGFKPVAEYTELLRSWVSALGEAGVDLVQYGQREKDLWQPYCVNCIERPRILGFVYGASISNWHVFVEHPGDRYAGIFWGLVENPEKSVPGAWIEEPVYLCEDGYFRWKQGRRKGRRSRV